MVLPREFRTDRLLLRRFRPADREPFAVLNADPRVMQHMPAPLSRQESDALAAPVWGRGYAREAARAALAFGFDALQRSEIVSFTVPGNLRSRRVMEGIGMSHDPQDDFDHPALPEGHPLRRHVLYRIARGGAPEVAQRNVG